MEMELLPCTITTDMTKLSISAQVVTAMAYREARAEGMAPVLLIHMFILITDSERI